MGPSRNHASSRAPVGPSARVVVVGVCLAVTASAITTSGRRADAQDPGPPNIVVIMTDDQRWNQLAMMPTARDELVAEGITFTRAIVSNPMCCPSRASFLTGTYSHTNGVWTNGDRGDVAGGWGAFRRGGHENNNLATWLDRAGYHTGLFGKYLNQYDDGSWRPPGWDRWVAFVGQNGSYYEYDLAIDGEVLHFGSDEAAYSTDVLTGYAEDFIVNADPSQPLFVYYAPYAPHGPSTPAPRHVDAEVAVRFPSNRSVNEANVSDKPRWVRALPLLAPRESRRMQARAIRQGRALIAVDDAIRRLVDAMERAGRTNTIYVLISDHGQALGEHRWTYKLDPYEPTVRELLVVRWDGTSGRGVRSSSLVQNVDLAPTLAEAAGVPLPRTDGVSLLNVLDGDGTVRRFTLTEHMWFERAGKPNPPTYCAIRTARFKYVRYETGEEEFYDLDGDRFEVRNRASSLHTRRLERAFARANDRADHHCDWMPST